MAAGLPAVVPGTREDEFCFVLDRGLGVDEVGGVGEPFVGTGENLAAEGCGREVCEDVSRTAYGLMKTIAEKGGGIRRIIVLLRVHHVFFYDSE